MSIALVRTLWIEKYRPKTLDEVVNQEEVVNGIKNLLANIEEMPHLLFAGPPGTGKTTLALIISRTIYGDNWRDYTLELNASDERGINVIRERVKVFSQYFTPSKEIPFKLVILDEADMMTPEAQTALRRIMEMYSRTTRFILIGNYLTRIISPIQSRCAIFRFRRLSENDVISYLSRICANEGVQCSVEVLKRIYEHSGGDMRKALNILQAVAHISFGRPTLNDVEEVVGKMSPATIGRIIDQLKLGDFRQSVTDLFSYMTASGLDGQEIIKLIFNELLERNLLTPQIADVLAKYDFRLTEGAYEEIQLTAMLAEIMQFLRSSA
ncbi:MAG: replication factor C small subunit [Candidatus Geothermarchaeota archaeon]